MNLYEKFNCSSKNELLEKVKNQDPSVKELEEFINYAKTEKEMDSFPINSPEAFAIYYQQYEGNKRINNNQMSLVFTNVKGRPIHHNVLDLNSDLELSTQLRTVMKSAFQERAAGLFIACEENIDKDILQNVSFKLKNVTDIDDVFFLNEEHTKMRSNMAGYSLDIDIEEGSNTDTTNENRLYQYPKYKEFTDFYAEENNVGLNIISDVQAIQENLKFGYQHENQEVGGFLFYDEDHNITEHKILFRGGINSTIIDLKVVLDHAIENDDTRGVIMFHNHPSGINSPSDEDCSLTDKLQETLNAFNYELADHYIVAEEGVYSFEKDDSFFESCNYQYGKSIRAAEMNRSKSFELDI